MEIIADIMLAAGALSAAFYCIVLSRRLKRFNRLEGGVGGAVAVLSVQVDDLTKTLERAQKAAQSSAANLGTLTDQAQQVAGRLELMIAAMHDLPEEPPAPAPPPKDVDQPEEGPLFLSQRNRVEEAVT